jgi:KaiC/GvpD/RAD55 family RecA-like ATPase
MTAMKRASQLESKPIEFVIDGIPAGMFTVVSGRPGEGKSTWATELIARVSQFGNVIASMHEDHQG